MVRIQLPIHCKTLSTIIQILWNIQLACEPVKTNRWVVAKYLSNRNEQNLFEKLSMWYSDIF